MENVIFWSEIGSGFWEPGGTPPPRIPRSNPLGKLPPPEKGALSGWILLDPVVSGQKVNSVLNSLLSAVSHTQNANLEIMTRHKP